MATFTRLDKRTVNRWPFTYRYYATIASDMQATNPDDAGTGSAPIAIRAEVGGMISVEINGTTVTAPIKAGETQWCMFDGVFASGTTATGITIYW